MKLTAKVDEVKRVSGRGLVFCANTTGGGFLHDVSNVDGFAVDDEAVVLVLTKNDAALLYRDILTVDAATPAGLSYPDLADLRDQLRPDPPPPFMEQTTAEKVYLGRDATHTAEKMLDMSPDNTETAEFRLGGTV